MRPLLPAAAAALAAASLASAAPAPGAEQELADRYAPIVALKEPQGPCGRETGKREPWRPVPVEVVLGNPEVELRGPGSGSPVVTEGPTAADLDGKGDGYFLDFPGNPLRPGCTYEADGQRFAEGQPSVTYAHVTTEAGREGGLAVEYWFYYYFNDFNNKHESDWEGIQVVFDVGTVEEALRTEPVEVGYAQHEGGEWAAWEDGKLERVGTHPVVYPAAGSHASYFSDRLWLGRSAETGIGCDNSTGPSRRIQLQAVLVPSEPPAADGAFGWLRYEGLWGQRERAPNNGPTGPNTKDRWLEPLTWQSELRGTSVSVPGVRTLGPSVSEAFCGAVGLSASVFNSTLDSPLVTIAVLVLLAGALVGIVLRTRWRPTAPEPIRARRGAGQILLASGRIYARRPLLFLGLGSVFVVLELATAGLEWVVDRLIAGRIELDFSLTALATIVVIPAVALALRNLDSGRSLGCVGSLRLSLRRFWSLLGAAAIVGVVQGLIALTVVGIPVAVYRFVRRVFVLNEVAVHGRSARASQGASVALVQGNWWRTGLLVGLLYAVAVAAGPVVGLTLLFTTRLSPTLIDYIGSAVYTAVFPYAAIAGALLHFDLIARHREVPETATGPSATRGWLSRATWRRSAPAP